MHSLFVRVFVLFWIAMAIIVAGSIAVTFTMAAREYEYREFQRRPAIAIGACAGLPSGGASHLAPCQQPRDGRSGPVHHRPRRHGHPRPAALRKRRTALAVLPRID